MRVLKERKISKARLRGRRERKTNDKEERGEGEGKKFLESRKQEIERPGVKGQVGVLKERGRGKDRTREREER